MGNLELPTLCSASRDLLARFPMPEGAIDALMSKKELAARFQISLPTLDTWIADGMPVHQQGGHGVAYQFRWSVCRAWRLSQIADLEEKQRLAAEAQKQDDLDLFGGESADVDTIGLGHKQRKAALEAEMLATRLAEYRGDLVRRASVVDAIERAFAAIRDGMDATPDRLARELSLDGAEIERLITSLDDMLNRAQAEALRLFQPADNAD